MFRMDDEYLNGYAKLCGSAATCIYMALCRHADRDQESWPSIRLLSEKLGLSKDTVIRGIKKLSSWRIIEVVKSKHQKTKRQEVNTYILVDRSCWVGKPGSTTRTGAGSQNKPEPGSKNTPKPGSTTGTEGNTVEGYTLKVGEITEEERERNLKALDDLRQKYLRKG